MSAKSILQSVNPGSRGAYEAAAHGFLSEIHFASALCVERRRSERSGDPFLLALVHLNGTHKTSGHALNGHPSLATKALCSVIRDTDVAGWYKTGEILGLIYTCLAEPAKSLARNVIDARLRHALPATLAVNTDHLRVTYHFFPDTTNAGTNVDNPAFPDQADQTARRVGHIIKRSVDVIGSLVALLLLWPLMLLIAAAIKFTSSGRVLFKQERVGQGGRIFTFLKFRSMFDKNDSSLHQEFVSRFIAGENVQKTKNGACPVYKLDNDPRVTPVGRLLRRSSLDELPQLFNVLKGEMSLIGPRPPVPYEYQRYSPWHRRRVIEMKPGMTGLWQVSGRSRTTFDEMVRLDLEYVREWSIWLDLKILLRTPAAVLSCEGAY
jgi:exopolysaccharide biosynthesis polyprenyl glycosylphosphotransferase